MARKTKLRKVLNLSYHALRGREADHIIIFGEIFGDILDFFRKGINGLPTHKSCDSTSSMSSISERTGDITGESQE